MPQARRSADRRRRVLYQTHTAPQTPSTPATRRAAEKLRAARQPAKAFGSRVGQPLRGRWFSLVPISRLAMTVVASLMLTLSMTLTLCHFLAFRWPSLAYNEAVARPLRINEPTSFASWWTSIVLMLAAGASVLIFQLRRHRSDDYRGHYRLWRMALIVLIAASIHNTVDLVGWIGGLLDLLFGDRAALSGANWLRIVLDVGGVILAMQLIAEVARCRAALLAMLAACGAFALMELAAWNVIAIDSSTMQTFVVAAPMLGFTCYLVSSTIYLRALYRQVRNITDDVTLRDRFASWIATWRDQDLDIDFPELEPAAATRVPAGRPTRSKPVESPREPATKAPAASPTKPTPSRQAPAATNTSTTTNKTGDPVEQQDNEKPKRRWFGLRAAKAELIDGTENEPKPVESDDELEQEKPKRRWFGLKAAKEESQDEAPEEKSSADESETPPQKKSWFSLRLQPHVSQTAEQNQEATSNTESDPEEAPDKKPGLLGRLFSRNRASEEQGTDEPIEAEEPVVDKNAKTVSAKPGGPLSRRSAPANAPASAAQKPPAQAPQAAGRAASNEIDPNDIDWDSLSKSERRRLRKQIKRSGRAA